MAKKILIAVSSAVLVFLLSSCGCETPECYKAKQDYEASQAEIRSKNQAIEREYQLAKLKAEAEIQKEKPESVRLQEAKNEETSVGEGISDAVTVGAGVYGAVKVIDILTR